MGRGARQSRSGGKAAGFWGSWGDIIGLVSAAAGILALFPVLTPIMASIAVVSAVGLLGAHAAADSITGNWNAATIAVLGADALAAPPAIGALAEGAKGAWAAARMNKVADVIVNDAGQAHLRGRPATGAAGGFAPLAGIATHS
ncbi:hypothetical protein J2Z21_007333 [Streptomyces griseochromogenes]|uniref:Uncharacterized protein n=2 Tax=Streptomyces griseochromogenes TaxID=68214 RepID=A0A1B1AYI4_9ACTN|nr:hypothetical protein [Streptomyces griseochromogenes]ANP51582.1 hypothetical protein AVL59_20010 [Streptomyces griseochromogenes]MBP2054330.1 hypothetical protein [Streptomyces griseochromogenes]